MKKIIALMTTVMFAGFVTVAYAKNGTAGTGTAAQADTTIAPTGTTVSPTKTTAVMNQNQVKTQNEGEEQGLMVQTEEQEEHDDARVGTKSAAPRSEVALEHMSVVAKGVENILTTRTLRGGIGDQVKQIAQEQKQSQDQVKLQMDKVASRSGLLKSLIGSDYKALKEIAKQITQNELRIKQLTELKTKLTNVGDIAMVQETIDALIQQNTSLQEMVDAENMNGSLFGWLVRLFTR